VSIDQALDMVGFGWGQIMVLIACGTAPQKNQKNFANMLDRCSIICQPQATPHAPVDGL